MMRSLEAFGKFWVTMNPNSLDQAPEFNRFSSYGARG